MRTIINRIYVITNRFSLFITLVSPYLLVLLYGSNNNQTLIPTIQKELEYFVLCNIFLNLFSFHRMIFLETLQLQYIILNQNLSKMDISISKFFTAIITFSSLGSAICSNLRSLPMWTFRQIASPPS